MKKTGNEFWNDPNAGATNESGFNAIAGGYRANTGFYYHTSTQGYWWSATENTTTNAWLRILYFDRTMIGRDNYAKKIGLSVRCIKD